ncbi:ABC transporter ATP-binding protein [Bacillus aquiflavi]|uniref:ABC transporter ATP-binding protein n=1 Tax=Bacillus aquiflavi TaxID=2672567 RepID=A0A6B3VV08_9BACI|nr:ABC transporter ATP-binding protein [Bacillus aquiflavi]MBA4536731.1 ABC transporter ATP-binding protein [Bacillus aquiflavi]NEY81098.1 ABC transporter ATP-binding protein [Bacillus aquiflavi]
MNEQAFIQLNNIAKHYNKFNRVDEINFSINKGEIFALCGGNGAGKSTLIKILTGILKPTAGDIFVNGQKANPMSKHYKEMFAYMPDDMLFPKQLTGYEILSFFGKLRQVSNEKVNAVLNAVGLAEDGKKMIKHYSKGMQQRLSLAQALLSDVKFIILDEPTNGLDPYWVYRFKELILEEKRKGKTILFTTHILTLVEEIADRAAFMERGNVIICEEVKKLTNKNGKAVSLEKVFFQKQILNG